MLPQIEFPKWTLSNGEIFSLWWEHDSQCIWFCSFDATLDQWVGLLAFQMGTTFINYSGGPRPYMQQCINKMNILLQKHFPELFGIEESTTDLPASLQNQDDETKTIVLGLMSLRLENNQFIL